MLPEATAYSNCFVHLSVCPSVNLVHSKARIFLLVDLQIPPTVIFRKVEKE